MILWDQLFPSGIVKGQSQLRIALFHVERFRHLCKHLWVDSTLSVFIGR